MSSRTPNSNRFEGFLRRRGRLLARFRVLEEFGWATRCVPLDAGASWLPLADDEEPVADPEQHAGARRCNG